MRNNQQLIRFNRVLTKKINKKLLKTLNVHKPLFSEHKQSINRVKITLKLTEKETELNQVKPRIANTFIRN